jgi:hypothetical protein
MFGMNYKIKYSGAKRTQELLFDKFLIELYQEAPKRDLLQTVEMMEGFRADYNREINLGRTGNYNKLEDQRKLVESFFKVADKVVGKYGIPQAVLEEVFKHTMDRNFKELDALSQLNSNFQKHAKHQQVARIENQILQEIPKLAKEIPLFGAAWNIFRAHELNMTATDDARTIMARNPDLPVPVQVKVSIQALRQV